MEKILEVVEVEKRYETTTAVDRLSFTVNRGEIFALLGPNGAGKTTTLRMLMGILLPDRGAIRYFLEGTPMRTPDPSFLGYLPEDRGLYQEMPIHRTLVYLAGLRGMRPQLAQQEASAWLERLGLAERAGEKLETLSKGNQQKVQFISAILHKPSLAVLDEPFSGLDPVNQELFIEVIRELREGGTTILLSAHHMSLVERLADRLLIVNRGRALSLGSFAELGRAMTVLKRLELVCEPAPTLEAIHELVPLLESAELAEDGRLIVTLHRDQPLNQPLAALAGRFEIKEMKSMETGLHDYFLKVIAADGSKVVQEVQP